MRWPDQRFVCGIANSAVQVPIRIDCAAALEIPFGTVASPCALLLEKGLTVTAPSNEGPLVVALLLLHEKRYQVMRHILLRSQLILITHSDDLPFRLSEEHHGTEVYETGQTDFIEK